VGQCWPLAYAPGHGASRVERGPAL
jgi:hypothetical protein